MEVSEGGASSSRDRFRAPAPRWASALDEPAYRTFRRLHESGCFVIPNPWDVGTARYLKHLGFKALATTSSGFAFTRGLPDMDWAVPLDAMLAHIAEIVAATDLPVNADFEIGLCARPGRRRRQCAPVRRNGRGGPVDRGCDGRSPQSPSTTCRHAVDRIRAARAAIDEIGSGVLLTARAECFLVRHPDPLRESIRRLQAYAEAGADVLYAPGPRTRDDIRAIVAAVAPKPVNVLVSGAVGLTVADLAASRRPAHQRGIGSRSGGLGRLHAGRRNSGREGSFAPFADNRPVRRHQ